MKKPIVAAAGVLAAATLALAPSATAGKGDVPTKVALNPDYTSTDGVNVTFKGKVSSRADQCVGGRKVVLRSKTDGVTYGSDKTNGDGKFKISFDGSTPPPSDLKITATAKERKVGKVTCAEGSDTDMLVLGKARW